MRIVRLDDQDRVGALRVHTPERTEQRARRMDRGTGLVRDLLHLLARSFPERYAEHAGEPHLADPAVVVDDRDHGDIGSTEREVHLFPRRRGGRSGNIDAHRGRGRHVLEELSEVLGRGGSRAPVIGPRARGEPVGGSRSAARLRTHNGLGPRPLLVSDQRLDSWFSLLRQGLSVEREFGRHSLEALVSIAETIEQSVYERGSLARTANGFAFCLNNPPLRLGAFSSLHLILDEVPISPERVRLRSGPGRAWRELTDLSKEQPLDIGPGARIEFAVDGPFPEGMKDLGIRLELQSIAIPPLVWFEFTDILRDGDTA